MPSSISGPSVAVSGAITFADRKVVNLRGRGNKIFRYTFCDRYPEHIFFGLRIEAR